MAGIQYENEELKVKISHLEKRNIRAKQLIKEKVTSLSTCCIVNCFINVFNFNSKQNLRVH